MDLTLLWGLIGILLAVVVVVGGFVRSRTRPPPEITTVPDESGSEIPHSLLAKLQEGVVLLNEALVPVYANLVARDLLDMPQTSLPPTLRSDELLSLARRALTEQAIIEAEITLWPTRRTARVRATDVESPPGVAIFLQDVTDEVTMQHVRRQFVVNASHELKTPVAGLLALAEAAKSALPEDVEKGEHFVDQVVREAERLGRLTNDLLELSRVEDPSYLQMASLDLAPLVRNEIDRLTEISETRDVKILPVLESRTWIKGDEQQLGVMIRNLLDNAIRYSHEAGEVTVETYVEDQNAVLRVIDRGVGIPLKAQARVFERFYRVDEGRDRARGGTGLGLSIVRHVAESHGGHVSLESQLGEGSIFEVRLPAHDGGGA
jgi:two-component system, OmpR family, phosphate regulon sensor histidine kinase PhoR